MDVTNLRLKSILFNTINLSNYPLTNAVDSQLNFILSQAVLSTSPFLFYLEGIQQFSE